MDPVMERLDRIEAKLDRALNKEAVSPEEAMNLTGCKSVRAQHRWFYQHNVKPYARGKYRTRDIQHRIAILALSSNP